MGSPKEKTPYITFYNFNNSWVCSGPWKYRAGRKYGKWAFPRREISKDNPQEKQLFHLIKDICETGNVIDQYPEIAKRLIALIAQSLIDTMKPFKTGKPMRKRHEFEKGKVTGGPTAGGKHVAGMQNMGASVAIEVDGEKKREFLMTIGYACGGNASVAMLVNGEKQTDLLLTTIGGWSTYKAAKVYLKLKPGKNQLLFRSQKKAVLTSTTLI